MTVAPRRIRGFLVALVVLVLSAGAVLAGGDGPPAAADHGLTIAEEASGKTVPVGPGDDLEAEPEEAEPEETEDEGVEDEAADNHGALVSEAARMETPEAFDGRHGAFVSCVARMNRGHLGPDADLSGLDLAALTPDDCDQGDDAAGAGEDEAAATGASADGPGNSVAAKARASARGAKGLGLGR